ncbi:MAG: alpha-galactosidase, partial [Myxococcales bacterium]|nr:alpha-galactosidase [Myxococcales bacterium]
MRKRRGAIAVLAVAVGCSSGGGGGSIDLAPPMFILNAAGTFDVDFPGFDGARLRGVDPRFRVDGVWHAASDYPPPTESRVGDRFEWDFSGPGLPEWTYRVRVAPGGAWADVDLEVRAPAGVVDGFEPIATNEAWVRGLGDEVYFLHDGYNIFSFSGVVRVTAADRARRAPGTDDVVLAGNNFDVFTEQLAQGWWWGSIAAPQGEATILAGALTTDLWKTAVVGEPSVPARAGLRVVQGTNGDRWDLARGPVASERVFLGAGGDYAALYQRYGEALAVSKPGLAWTGEAPRLWSSWHQSFDRVTAEDVLRNADALAADPVYDPIRYVQLDDGWMEAWGDWTANEKFPDGMAALADQVRARGRIPGIWVAPTLVDSDSRLAADHPEWLLRDAAGSLVECVTCSLGAIGRQVFT